MCSAKNYTPVSNDNLSRRFDAVDIVPDNLKGSEEFLDLVTWNIRFFHDRDSERVERISQILSELNGDVIVLQEILDDSLEPVIKRLEELGAGHYEVAYGTTGGNQRVALLWDLDWIRAKDDISELAGKGEVTASNGKDAFPRLPVRGYFTAITYAKDATPFDFQLVGVHLKSQRGGGGPQREAAGDWLANWIEESSVTVDSDIIIAGDWNEKPSAKSWQQLHKLEKQGELMFGSINSESNISHLYYKNKNNLGSRLDLTAISIAAYDEVVGDPTVVRWTSLDELLSTSPKASEIRSFLQEIRHDISDHMPVVTRFHFEDQSA
jgi:endonuclease/exonuclease/phosphatase family metal-dependent hydrolase